MFHRSLLVGILMAVAASAQAALIGVFANPGVPAAEKASLGLVYEFPIPVVSGGWNSTPVIYSINNAAAIPIGSFGRVAYYLELEKPDTSRDWVYASFDAAGFTNDASKTGVPNTASGEYYRYGNTTISNMNVYSNVAGIVTGTGIATGNVEFWPSNYGGGNDYGVPGAASSFDFGDGGSGTSGGHGSMQIHNYGAGQTLFAYNAWGTVRTSELGIGNQVGGSGNPDWTFNTTNISSYTLRTLQILVSIPPELTWDGTVNDWGTAHWLGAPPTYPDASAKATIGDGIVTVEANHAAYSLTMTGGQLAIGAGNTLDVAGNLDAAGGAVALGAGSTLKAGGGAIGSLTTSGNSTIEVSGSLSVAGSTYNDQGIAGTMTKRGAGTLSLDNVSGSGVIAADTVFRIEAGTLETIGADPLGGSQHVVLAGGTLTVEGMPFMVDGLAGSLFRSIPRNETYVNLDGASYQHTSGRVFTGDKASTILTTAEEAGYNILVTGSTQCDNNNDWGPFPTLSSDWEDFVTAYSGRFTPRYDGVHNFHWNNDDRGLMFIDLNDDNVFDNSERVAGYAWNSNGNVTLNAGQGYNVIYMAQEYGGGRNVWWAMTEPGGGEAIVNPSDGRGAWQTGGSAAIDLQTTLTVDTAGLSTLQLISGYGANLRDLALKDGALQITGATGLTVEQASISAGTSGTVGLITDTPTVLTGVAGFEGNGQTVRLAKGGDADLILNKLGTGLDNATFAVEGGRLVGVHGSNPFGAAALEVNGGEIVLSSAGGDVTYDNPVHVTGDGTMTAGQAGGGVAGPLTVTLGSTANGVSIDAGKTLTLRSTDSYALDVAGQLNSGNVTITEGTVALSGGGSAANLEVKAAATASTPGVNLTEQFRVGDLRITATGGSFGVSGDDLRNPSAAERRTISLTGGQVSVRNGGAMPDGLEAWFDASTGVTVDGSNNVTAWADQSGNNRNAVTYQGTGLLTAGEINGLPAVLFGENENLEVTGTEFFAHDTYLVFRSDSGTGVFGPNSGGWGSPFGPKDNGDDNDRSWMFDGGDDRFWNGETPGAVSWNGNVVSSADTFDMSGVAGAGGSDMSDYMVLKVTAGIANNLGVVRTYTLGTRNDQWSNLKFATAEILAFDHALTATEENNIGGYLASKYGITAPNYTGSLDPLPINMPYTDIAVTANSTLMLDTSDPAVLGNLTLGGANLAVTGGAPSVSFAELRGNGTIVTAAELILRDLLSPGMSIGTLTVQGDMTLDSATFLIEVTNTLPGSEAYDQLIFEGELLQLVNSILVVSTPLHAFNMHVGSEISIINFFNGTVSDTFDGLAEGAEFTDANGVYRWEIHYGTSRDYAVTLRLTFIPEPATLSLLGLGLLALARRRRKRG